MIAKARELIALLRVLNGIYVILSSDQDATKKELAHPRGK